MAECQENPVKSTSTSSPICTTVQVYLRVFQLWYMIGLCPLHVKKSIAPIDHSHVEVNHISDEKAFAIDGLTKNGKADGKKLFFPVYILESYKSTGVHYWIMVCFFCGSWLHAVTRLIQVVTRDHRVNDAWQNVTKGGIDPAAVSGANQFFAAFVWITYASTCCAVHVIHLWKGKNLCDFIANWQMVEGSFLADSRALNSVENGRESYIRTQRNWMRLFICGYPISIIFMGFATTYPRYFPVSIHTSVSEELLEEHPWIYSISYAVTWIQAGFFLLCESQTELVAVAFTRSIYLCLQALSRNVTEEYSKPKTGSKVYKRSFIGIKDIDIPADRVYDPEDFNDSIYHYAQLSSLVDEFNEICCWPLLTRKAFTLFKICCYVYLLLRYTKYFGVFGGIVFFYGAVAIFLKYGIILLTMGRVRGESEKFLKQWKKALLAISPRQKMEEERRLQRYEPVEFRIGVFYVVHSHTILTFSSVVLTYLIILLQLRF